MNTQQLDIAKRQLDIDRRQLEIEIQEADIAAVTAENYELAISIRDKIYEILAPGLPTHSDLYTKFMTTSKKTKTLGWTKIMGYNAYINQGLICRGEAACGAWCNCWTPPLARAADGTRPSEEVIAAWFGRNHVGCQDIAFPNVENCSPQDIRDKCWIFTTKAHTAFGGERREHLAAWIFRPTNELLKNMNKESGSAVYISPGADIELLKMSGFEIIWATEDTIA